METGHLIELTSRFIWDYHKCVEFWISICLCIAGMCLWKFSIPSCFWLKKIWPRKAVRYNLKPDDCRSFGVETLKELRSQYVNGCGARFVPGQ